MESTSFRTMLGETPTRIDVVVTFLALLELVKRYHVDARQESLFGDIQCERLEGWNEGEEFETEFD